MPRSFRPGVWLLAGCLALAAASPGLAQESSSTGLPVTPDPAECATETVTFGDLIIRAQAMASAGEMASPIAASPATGDEGFTLPAGEPADPAVVEAITATARELVACLNSGDPLIIFAFTSDRFLMEVLPADIIETQLDMIGTPGPELEMPAATPLAPEQYASLLAIHEVTLLPDGRVGALVETLFPMEMPDVQVDYMVFAEQDGRWLLDELVEDLEAQFPPLSATPVP